MNYVSGFISQFLDLESRQCGMRSPDASVVKVTKPEVRHEEHEECSICLSKIEKFMAGKLPCCHWFHQECISRWLVLCRTCPLCRQPVGAEAPWEMNQKLTDELMIWFSSFHVPGF